MSLQSRDAEVPVALQARLKRRIISRASIVREVDAVSICGQFWFFFRYKSLLID